MHPKSPGDSNSFERGTAMALRAFLFLLAAYIVFHKIFPFSPLRARLADMTAGGFLLSVLESVLAVTGAAYILKAGYVQPDLRDRDRLWCERWTGLAFAVITISIGSVFIVALEGRGTVIEAARSVAGAILWLLF